MAKNSFVEEVTFKLECFLLLRIGEKSHDLLRWDYLVGQQGQAQFE